jgi:hypothetical protein
MRLKVCRRRTARRPEQAQDLLACVACIRALFRAIGLHLPPGPAYAICRSTLHCLAILLHLPLRLVYSVRQKLHAKARLLSSRCRHCVMHFGLWLEQNRHSTGEAQMPCGSTSSSPSHHLACSASLTTVSSVGAGHLLGSLIQKTVSIVTLSHRVRPYCRPASSRTAMASDLRAPRVLSSPCLKPLYTGCVDWWLVDANLTFPAMLQLWFSGQARQEFTPQSRSPGVVKKLQEH